MPKRSKHSQQGTDEPPPTAPPVSQYHTEHYGKSRHFAAYAGQALIAVTLYRKGAEAITARLEEKDRAIAALQGQLAEQKARIAALTQAGAAAPPQAPPVAANDNAPVWRPPRQLPLIAEDLTAYRITSPRRPLRCGADAASRPAPTPRRS